MQISADKKKRTGKEKELSKGRRAMNKVEDGTELARVPNSRIRRRRFAMVFRENVFFFYSR